MPIYRDPRNIKLDDFSSPDDNTDLNASTSAHGLLPKLSGTSTEFLNGSGAFSTPSGSSGGYTFVVKTANESVTSSTTVQNDDELFFSATSGKAFAIMWGLVFSNSAAGGGDPGFKMAVGEDTTVRGQTNLVGLNTSSSIVNVAVSNNQTATAGWGCTSVDRFVNGEGNHNGNGGTFRLLWAQTTSNGTPTILKAGSWLAYRQLN